MAAFSSRRQARRATVTERSENCTVEHGLAHPNKGQVAVGIYKGGQTPKSLRCGGTTERTNSVYRNMRWRNEGVPIFSWHRQWHQRGTPRSSHKKVSNLEQRMTKDGTSLQHFHVGPVYRNPSVDRRASQMTFLPLHLQVLGKRKAIPQRPTHQTPRSTLFNISIHVLRGI